MLGNNVANVYLLGLALACGFSSRCGLYVLAGSVVSDNRNTAHYCKNYTGLRIRPQFLFLMFMLQCDFIR